MKRIFLSPPWVDEAERVAVNKAFDSGYVAPCGPMVDAFEAALSAYTGLSVCAVTSGSAALDLLMEEFGVDDSWIVFASDLTFIASVSSAYRRGANLVFIDSAADTGTMDVGLLERALGDCRRQHKLVVVTDIYGRCCDYLALEKLCQEFKAKLVIDAAESVGSFYVGNDGRLRSAGDAGDAAIYSFNGNKIVTTSGGGAVLSRDSDLVARARKRAQQSRENVVWYEHHEVGYNYRLSNISAAIGCAQLKKLEEIRRRKAAHLAAYKQAAAKSVSWFPCASYTRSNDWLSVAIFSSSKARDDASARLNAINAENRPIWKPMHLQPVFAGCTFITEADPRKAVSTRFFERGLCLPSGAGMSVAMRKRVIDAVFTKVARGKL